MMGTHKIDGMFPRQKVSKREKNKEWREKCVDILVGKGDSQYHGNGGNVDKKEMKINYDLMNSIYDLKDLKHITNPYDVDEGFPAVPQNVNVIRSKINLLLGEETKRPSNIRVIRTSDASATEYQEKYKQLLTDYIQATIMSKLGEEEYLRYQEAIASGEIMPPEHIDKFMKRSYKDSSEVTAYHTLKYLQNKLNLNNEFNKSWYDALVAGTEVVYVGVQNNEPFAERVNPLYFSHDLSPDLEFIEDGDWACRKMLMTYTEVYDRLYDKMDEKDLNHLIDIIDGRPTDHQLQKKNMVDDFNSWQISHIDNMRPNNHDEYLNNGTVVPVYHVCWKSFKKIGFVLVPDEMGNPQQIIVDEDYKVSGYEFLQKDKKGKEVPVIWDWVIEVWEGYKVGKDLYIGIQPIDYQHISLDNPNSQKLPYTGTVYSNINTKSKSLVSILKPLQYMYIVIWYRLELAMARDKGKVLNMDITQIPKSMNIDINKWIHYLSSIGVNLINPYDSAWDVPGRDGSVPSTFNQFAAIDLTMANVIDQYINLMSKIESMVGDLSGVSRQREGQMSQYDLNGTVASSINQSSLITELLFWKHDQVKKRVYSMLLNTAKEVFKNTNKKKLHFLLEDGSRAFLDISETFLYEDMDIFISDSTKDVQNLETIKALYQPAMQNGASLLDIAEIIQLDNMTMIKEKLTEIEDKRNQQQQQAQQQQQEHEKQLQEMEQQQRSMEIELKQQELELTKYKIDKDAETKIVVAELGAYRFQRDLDADGDGTPDPMEIARLAIDKEDLHSKNFDLNRKNEIKEKEIISKENQNNRKLDLEEKKMKMQMQLQKQKDEAAMEREKLKAQTAIKNKTVGEKK